MANLEKQPVLKIGGVMMGNVNNVEACVNHVVTHEASPSVIVVSAVEGVTDQLVTFVDHLQSGNRFSANEVREEIIFKHEALITDLGYTKSGRGTVLSELLFVDEQLELAVGSYGQGFAKPERLPPVRDYILSLGEYISSHMLHQKLLDAGIEDVKRVDAFEVVRTDSEFGHAKVNMDETVAGVQRVIAPKLRQGQKVVLPGFYGVDKYGNTTTMERNSSDKSGALKAYALEVDLWLAKGVPGMFDRNPKKYEDARFLPQITYKQASELARAEERSVVHPDVIVLMERRNLNVVVFDPRQPGQQTVINGGERAA